MWKACELTLTGFFIEIYQGFFLADINVNGRDVE